MLVSWWACGVALWFTMFKQGCRTFVMSKKEQDANALIDRIKIIYDKLPVEFKQQYPADPFSYLKLQWSKNNSIIQGVPQGADQVRGYACNLMIMDEVGFQEKAMKSYDAIKPSLEGGGKLLMISTPNGKEFFYRTVRDLW